MTADSTDCRTDGPVTSEVLIYSSLAGKPILWHCRRKPQRPTKRYRGCHYRHCRHSHHHQRPGAGTTDLRCPFLNGSRERRDEVTVGKKDRVKMKKNWKEERKEEQEEQEEEEEVVVVVG